jgi:hypothetical protein
METRKSSRSVIITMSQLLLAKDSDFPPLTTTPPYLDFSKENTFTMVFHNSLGWTRRQLISVKTTSLALKVHDSFGKEVPIQVSDHFYKVLKVNVMNEDKPDMGV